MEERYREGLKSAISAPTFGARLPGVGSWHSRGYLPELLSGQCYPKVTDPARRVPEPPLPITTHAGQNLDGLTFGHTGTAQPATAVR